MTQDLGTIAKKIEAAHEAAVKAARTVLEHAIEAGRLLTEAKALVKHGDWLPWLETNTKIGTRQAQRYMRLYEMSGLLEHDLNASSKSLLTITEAEQILAAKREPQALPSVRYETKVMEMPNLKATYEEIPGTAAHLIRRGDQPPVPEPVSLNRTLPREAGPELFSLKGLITSWNDLPDHDRKAFLEVLDGSTDDVRLEDVMEARSRIMTRARVA